MKANKFIAVAFAALTLMACNKKEEPQADKLILDKTEATIEVGATVQLTANMDVTWTSSNEAVATVEAGLVKGIAAGEANITAKAVNSNELAVCKITVNEGGVTPPPAAEISVTDNSIEDWDALPKEKVASCACPEDGMYLGLKGVAVYADAVYINILVEYDPEEIVDRDWTPFHVYINTDNSDETGGYGDQWNDANTDILMEGAVFALADEADPSSAGPCAYDPEVFAWTGEIGGTGWNWEGLTIPAAFCQSQHVGNYIEFRMIRELIPTTAGWNADEFGIGFDIQQSWESVGILPLVSPTEENPTGHTVKLQVKIDK